MQVEPSLDIVQPSAGQNRGRLTERIAGRARPSNDKRKGKGKNNDKNRHAGRGFSSFDQDVTAEGAGGGDGPEQEPPSIRPFDDYLDLELGAVTLRHEEESSRVAARRLASGVSSLVNEWCKTYRAVDTSPLPQWCSSAGIPERLCRGRGQQRCAVHTATGELATDHGGARISGRLNGGPLAWSTWRRVWCGCQKNASFGRNGWVTKGGRYLIPNDSALTHMIRKMIDKEGGTSQCNVIELYEERCVLQLLQRDEGGRIR